MKRTKLIIYKRRIGGKTYERTLDAHFHEDIGRFGVSGPAAIAAELDIACEVAADRPTGEGLNWIRRMLGLTGKELGALLGVRFETVSRWERGEVDVDRRAWLLVGDLVLEKAGKPIDLRSRMERLAKPKRARAS